jgi:hypothetical protein
MWMNRSLIPWLLMAVTLPFAAFSEEPGGESGLFKRAASVDKPIPETYEPLNSTYVGDGEKLNEDIEQSWELKKQTREQEAAAAAKANSAERQALEKRIQEPGDSSVPLSEPQISDTGKSLEIRGD